MRIRGVRKIQQKNKTFLVRFQISPNYKEAFIASATW
ncbi:MAG: hypothetical protein ACI8X3_002150 [Saprospiraceae bacterium]|jgi:hypothetical protein